MLVAFYMLGNSFVKYCWRLSEDLSNPTIIMKARTGNGQIIHLDDYREAYWWLRDNTPEDARVMAWWDYGYQISAIANRTTIADGNTWNHEHIALLGKALTTDLDQGWEIARHLADYLLLWAGGGGDDLAKSPHLARIANSVYRDHCPDDPTCRGFGFVDRQGTPSNMMRRSLLYNLHGHRIKPDVVVSPDRFVEVYKSKYGKVRIYKISGVSEESKQWVADPANRKCDAPGSWFCPGQYPPGLKHILDTKSDFRQLEDFNRKDGGDEEYQKAYFENLFDPKSAKKKAM
jgi:dolichyl-diphosphooligosaccharide--protein glycosyltransferase